MVNVFTFRVPKTTRKGPKFDRCIQILIHDSLPLRKILYEWRHKRLHSGATSSVLVTAPRWYAVAQISVPCSLVLFRPTNAGFASPPPLSSNMSLVGGPAPKKERPAKRARVAAANESVGLDQSRAASAAVVASPETPVPPSKEQQAVITAFRDAPLGTQISVQACAGSGKTTTLARVLDHAIQAKGRTIVTGFSNATIDTFVAHVTKIGLQVTKGVTLENKPGAFSSTLHKIGALLQDGLIVREAAAKEAAIWSFNKTPYNGGWDIFAGALI